MSLLGNPIFLRNGKEKANRATWLLPPGALRRNRVYLLALGINLVFLACGVLFILYSSQLSQEDTLGYVQMATQQTRFAVEEHIREEFKTLMAAAVVAEDRDCWSTTWCCTACWKAFTPTMRM